jgi:hypothetical protein
MKSTYFQRWNHERTRHAHTSTNPAHQARRERAQDQRIKTKARKL